MLVQVSYAIGIAHPLSIYVDTYGSSRVALSDGEIADRIGRMFDLRPASIVRRFGLKNPIFEATASYGHFGNRPRTESVRFIEAGRETTREVEFFGWEKLDAVADIKKEFGIELMADEYRKDKELTAFSRLDMEN
jgi:S-adenosylmethionine synthetase